MSPKFLICPQRNKILHSGHLTPYISIELYLWACDLFSKTVLLTLISTLSFPARYLSHPVSQSLHSKAQDKNWSPFPILATETCSSFEDQGSKKASFPDCAFFGWKGPHKSPYCSVGLRGCCWEWQCDSSHRTAAILKKINNGTEKALSEEMRHDAWGRGDPSALHISGYHPITWEANLARGGGATKSYFSEWATECTVRLCWIPQALLFLWVLLLNNKEVHALKLSKSVLRLK